MLGHNIDQLYIAILMQTFLNVIKSKEIYQIALSNESFSEITTEIRNAPEYFLAEEYHQQYLAKNPNGYCGLGGTGCSLDL